MMRTTERWLNDEAKQLFESYIAGANAVAVRMRSEAAKQSIKPLDLDEQIGREVKPFLDAAIALRAGFHIVDHVWIGELPASLAEFSPRPSR